jgi:hypothetical protein
MSMPRSFAVHDRSRALRDALAISMAALLLMMGEVAQATIDGAPISIEWIIDGGGLSAINTVVGPGRELDCSLSSELMCLLGYGGPGFYVDVSATGIELGGTSSNHTFTGGTSSEGARVTLTDLVNFVEDAQLISSGLSPAPEAKPAFASVFVDFFNRSGDTTTGTFVALTTTTTPDPVPGPQGSLISAIETTEETGYSRFTIPSMSPQGTLAYGAFSTGQLDIRVFDGNSASTVTDSIQNPLLVNVNPIDVNDAGDVTFWTFTAIERIFLVDGLGTTLLATGSSTELSRTPKLNNPGVVVFDRVYQIIASDHGIETIIEPATAPTPIGGSSPAINDAGLVAFLGFHGAVGNPDRGIYAGSGGALENWMNAGASSTDFLQGVQGLTESGEAVFRSTLDGGGAGIFVASAQGLRTVATTLEGYSGLSSTPGINNGGIVTVGSEDTILIETASGLQHVVGVGDGIGGWPITQIGFIGAIDDTGRIAFQAELANGTDGIYIARLAEDIPGLSATAQLGLVVLLGAAAWIRSNASASKA